MTVSELNQTAAPGARVMRSLTLEDGTPAPLEQGRWIPVPKTPIQPVLSLSAFLPRGQASPSTLLDDAPGIYVTAGRMAIGVALKLMDLRAGDRVLIPAYHCASMVEPLACVKAEPAFYRINEDLSADLDDIEKKLEGPVRALMACNYFGFPQQLDRLRDFCDAHGLQMIEDCAHSYFGSYRGKLLGSFGDFATFSLTKFFPVRDGGVLVSNSDPSLVERYRTQSQGFYANIGALLDSLEQPLAYDRLPALKPVFNTLRALKTLAKGASSFAGGKSDISKSRVNPAQQRSGLQGDFAEDWLNIRCAWISEAISRQVSYRRIVEKRRENYCRLRTALSGLRGCRPLLPELPQGVVPYMFPMWFDRLNEVFPALEDKGVPMQRFGQFLWRGVDRTTCSTSSLLSEHSIQLPCHQELTEEELGMMIDAVAAVASAQPAGGR